MKSIKIPFLLFLFVGLSFVTGFQPVNGYSNPTKVKFYPKNSWQRERQVQIAQNSLIGNITYKYVMDLKYGTSNFEVRVLQNRLKAEGYYKPTFATGHFGPSTLEAVIKYQLDNGITGTGYVGPYTRSLLNSR